MRQWLRKHAAYGRARKRFMAFHAPGSLSVNPTRPARPARFPHLARPARSIPPPGQHDIISLDGLVGGFVREDQDEGKKGGATGEGIP